VPSRNGQQVAFAHRAGVPEGPREPVFEGDPVPGGEAEGAGRGRRHRCGSDLAGRRVISSAPSRPAATQAAQRQALTGRRPTRLDWQTGHQWSYRLAGASLGLGWCFRRALPGGLFVAAPAGASRLGVAGARHECPPSGAVGSLVFGADSRGGVGGLVRHAARAMDMDCTLSPLVSLLSAAPSVGASLGEGVGECGPPLPLARRIGPRLSECGGTLRAE